ncbi:TlpA family protein disulfide reductase [Chryseobacterium sp. RP-3-3]|uniref:TlpA family protein disulfide reductase n=1 Tax=Chryseobacterium antibioticum TaxID=2728847 RepID=A0A7Y0FPX4_9FLAO|nr:TlpA disulfide reductase family protein [Chryseobacterium antibioticum]NML68562.1 TlpA family protein disulfide reductase [Chryseobacterium antibioticum]
MKVFLTLFSVLILTGYTIAQQTKIEIGQQAPEITLSKTDGSSFSLSSLKGKVVLIDFWATWCAPCVGEQPELKTLYDMFSDQVKEQTFEILGVSLDKNKESWQKAIDRFGISWIQVSDLKFWKSPVAKAYEIEELPFNVVIDGQGKIIAKNLHGKELEEFIRKYFTSN